MSSLSAEITLMFEKPSIGIDDTLFKFNPRAPTHCSQAADIHQFSRSAVGFRRVSGDAPLKSGHPRHHPRKIEDGDIPARAHIDMAQHRICIGLIADLVEIKHEK